MKQSDVKKEACDLLKLECALHGLVFAMIKKELQPMLEHILQDKLHLPLSRAGMIEPRYSNSRISPPRIMIEKFDSIEAQSL